jgi:hypothetical protein
MMMILISLSVCGYWYKMIEEAVKKKVFICVFKAISSEMVNEEEN